MAAVGAIFAAVQQARGVAGAVQGGNAAGAVGQASGALASLASAGMKAAGSITGLASSLTGGLLAPLDAIKQSVGAISELVGLANPAVMTQFTIAMNDAMAVMGHALVPVMQALTTITRSWGDALAKLMPVIQPMIDAWAQYLVVIAQQIVPVMQAAAPFIQLFADAIRNLYTELGYGIAFLGGVLTEFLNVISAAFGLESRFDPTKTSQGAAKRPATVQGVEQTASSIFRDSAQNMIRFEAGAAKQKDQLGYMQEIADAMKAGREQVKAIADNVEAIWKWFQSQKDTASNAIDTATGVAKDAFPIFGLFDNLRRSILK